MQIEGARTNWGLSATVPFLCALPHRFGMDRRRRRGSLKPRSSHHVRQATNRFENCSFARSRIQLATSAATESSASLRDTTNKYAPRSFTP